HECENERCGKPDPEQLALDDGQASVVEESADADWRDDDGAEREEETCGAERCEECDAESAVCHRVERAVRGCCEEKEEDECFPVRCVAEEKEDDDEGERKGKDERVCDASMSEHAAVRNAEREGDNVCIRQNRAHHRENPETRGHG